MKQDLPPAEVKTGFSRALTFLSFLAALYFFFVCIELMGVSFKLLGQDFAQRLFQATQNPIAGLFIGLLATSIMQSSSSTTSIIVGMVAAGTLSIEAAVPMVMGANIGTTITNALVSLGHIHHKLEFERAFAGAIVHDFFNLCTVIVFLPLEIQYHFIQRTATFIAAQAVGVKGASFHSPLKAAVKPVVELIAAAGKRYVDNPRVLAIILLLVALGLLLFTLSRMVKIMRGAIAEKLELIVDKYLFTGTFRGLLIGLVVTAIVQSSSVTTSLVVPLLGAGIVQLEMVYPYMVGANIGTTVTALMAALVTGNPAGLTIALCHLVFNVFGTLIFLPLRVVPISLARGMGEACGRRRWVALVFIVLLFFLIPAVLMMIL